MEAGRSGGSGGDGNLGGKRRTWPEFTSRARLRLLPLPVRALLVVILVAVAYPGFAALYGAFHGAGAGGVLAWSSHHLPLVWSGAAAAVVVALLVVEPPRDRSARAYVSQLRDRFHVVQGEFERAIEAALPDRKLSEFDQPGPYVPGAASERLDGLQAVDNTRR